MYSIRKENHHFLPAPIVLCVLSALCVASTASAGESKNTTHKLPTITVSAPSNSEFVQLRNAVFEQVLTDRTGRSLLARNQADNMHDLLRYETGVSVNGDNGRHGNAGWNIRGLSGNRIGVQVDGEELPSSLSWGHESISYGRDLVEPDTLRSIDVNKGPLALVSNPNNLGGGINLRTYDPSDFLSDNRHHYIGLKSSYNSADSGVGLTGTLAVKKNTMSGLFMYTRRQAHEINNFGDIGGFGATRTKTNPQDITAQNVLAKLHLGSESQYFDVLFGDYWRRTNTDMYSLASMSIPYINARDSVELQRFSIAYHNNTLPGPLPYFYVKFYRHNFNGLNRLFYSDANAQLLSDKTNIQELNQNTTGAEASLSGHYRGALISNDVKLFSSYSHHETSLISQGGLKWQPDSASKKFTASITDKLKVANRFAIEPSVTYRVQETNSRPDKAYDLTATQIIAQGQKAWLPLYHNTSITPALRMSFDVNPNWKVYAAYARGQRNPDFSATSSFVHPAGPGVSMTFITNPYLKSETSNNFELGTTVAMNNWATKFSVFNNEYKNFINLWGAAVQGYPNIVLMSTNIDKVHTYGAEWSTIFAPTSNIQLRAGLSWMKGTQENNGLKTDFVGTQPLKAILGAGYHSNKWGIDLDWTLVKGTHLTVANNAFDNNPRSLTKPLDINGYGVLDLTGYWQPVSNVIFRAGVYNLTDKDYITAADAALYSNVGLKLTQMNSQPRRNYAVSVNVNF